MANIAIGDNQYELVQDSLLPEGKRSFVRSLRATSVQDPARIRKASWQVFGKIGQSLESVSGELSTDFTQNLETRHPRRLMSLGERTAVSLSGANPAGAGAAAGTFYGSSSYGSAYYGGTQALFGSSGGGGDVVRHFAEIQGYLFADHGVISTQVDPQTWGVVASEILPAEILTDVKWYGFSFLGFGAASPTQIRFNTSASGASYGQTNSINPDTGTAMATYVRAFATGSDRLWGIFDDAPNPYHVDSAPLNTDFPSTQGQVSYALDSWLRLASLFQVGDKQDGGNGIGPYGPFTHFGYNRGLFAVTDQGKPVPLSKALQGHQSANNGSQWADPGWGWNYAITDIGVRAINGSVDNPVGIGERMKEFTGHSGRPTAIWHERGEMWIA
ncbi:MAG TPA: hypothetical protein VFH61_18590, partial [Thermoleophilia bacterium]|nr:hypothetical protein [Thermoleophilia bacterium]